MALVQVLAPDMVLERVAVTVEAFTDWVISA
jgi:hypothetical protein